MLTKAEQSIQKIIIRTIESFKKVPRELTQMTLNAK